MGNGIPQKSLIRTTIGFLSFGMTEFIELMKNELVFIFILCFIPIIFKSLPLVVRKIVYCSFSLWIISNFSRSILLNDKLEWIEAILGLAIILYVIFLFLSLGWSWLFND
ncbi:MAG: hypothetical protein H8E72_09940 [Candidatus Marinimicrobia bacterium]|nr:hypothetical protein [Candidatus Neomarinimicrobiota bacterium]